LLAGLDLSVPVLRAVRRDHSRPAAPRPGLVGTTPEGRTDGRAPTTATADHAGRVIGVHRVACRAGSRFPLRVVECAAGRGGRRRCDVCPRIWTYWPRVSGEHIHVSDYRGCSGAASYF